MSAQNQELAFYFYPEPHGTRYYAKDLMDPRTVELLFSYESILLACIWRAGWDFLIHCHGYEKLYQLGRSSDWFDSEALEEFIRDVHWHIEQLPADDPSQPGSPGGQPHP